MTSLIITYLPDNNCVTILCLSVSIRQDKAASLVCVLRGVVKWVWSLKLTFYHQGDLYAQKVETEALSHYQTPQ